eukprot:TRINITY_DN761_c0_g1_i2.p1 TRINITY_DN761_c0_g1~~TRINITY_DN761_c0_g1_i2.p1  ORF type:complete len:935 (-),score=287.32 TRINITY_DN761_c0_g1_i2:373-3177(-)
MSNPTSREASVGSTVADSLEITPVSKTQKNVKKTKTKKIPKKKPDELHRWDFSCNLPETPFSKEANSIATEARILGMWQSQNLYQKMAEMNTGGPNFVLHDGPPFANGNIHQGHAFNKITKDMMCKVKRMQGYHVSFIPGWDCHGLPIELKLKASDDQMGRTQLISSCRDYASSWIQQQKEQFMKLGVKADWSNPYLTMDPNYESDVLNLFSRFVEKDLISRKAKTTPWCPSCETVLAIAEIQYQTVQVDSHFVLFPILPSSISPSLQSIISASDPPCIEISFLVWTTALWSVPMNRALLIRPKTQYCVVQVGSGRMFITSFKSVQDLVQLEPFFNLKILATLDSKDLVDLCAINPVSFEPDSTKFPTVPKDLPTVPILEDDAVTLSEGTAILHLAPGCGHKDYLIGIQRNLQVYSPIDHRGKYDNDIMPQGLTGMSMEEGQNWIVQNYASRIFKRDLPWEHLEPHCWRCQEKLVFRSTLQWFFNLKNVNEISQKRAEKINFLPKQSKSVFLNVLKSRDDWCLSRQRIWGVPIPALTCQRCQVSTLQVEIIRGVAEKIRREGIEFWARMEDVSDLQREGIVTSDFTCQKCQCQDFKLERDILDVWFVSGLSKCIVLPDSEVDVYLEGKDQHRGWFSSSLLCSSVLEKNCTKSFLTHGFCYDNNGEKISKSSTLNVKSKMSTTLLNVNQAMEYRSADVLRLWAASIPFQGDISHSDFVMRTVRHDYMKIRKTFRTLLGHLYDFSPADLIPISQLLHLDQFTLQTLHNFYVKVVKCYNSWDFSTATKLIISYLKEDLRCFFLDAGKFRLYHSKPRSFERRSAQSCVWIILETMVHLLAPILSFLVEEVWECLGTDSIHLHQFVAPPNVFLETCQSDVKKASEKHKLVSTLEKNEKFCRKRSCQKRHRTLGKFVSRQDRHLDSEGIGLPWCDAAVGR